MRGSGVVLLVAFAASSCATAAPRTQIDVQSLMWDAARECKNRFITIVSVENIDASGRLSFRYVGRGDENEAFQRCYRELVDQKIRAAINLPPERLTRDPDSPSRISVPVEPAGGVGLIVVRLNGTTDARMIVDTGAAFTIVSPAIASRLGLAVPADARQSVAHVAGGGRITMPRAVLASAKVGSVAVENLYVGVYDAFPNAPQVQGVLGLDFLRHFRVSFEQGGQRLVLEPQD